MTSCKKKTVYIYIPEMHFSILFRFLLIWVLLFICYVKMKLILLLFIKDFSNNNTIVTNDRTSIKLIVITFPIHFCIMFDNCN